MIKNTMTESSINIVKESSKHQLVRTATVQGIQLASKLEQIGYNQFAEKLYELVEELEVELVAISRDDRRKMGVCS